MREFVCEASPQFYRINTCHQTPLVQQTIPCPPLTRPRHFAAAVIC